MFPQTPPLLVDLKLELPANSLVLHVTCKSSVDFWMTTDPGDRTNHYPLSLTRTQCASFIIPEWVDDVTETGWFFEPVMDAHPTHEAIESIHAGNLIK